MLNDKQYHAIDLLVAGKSRKEIEELVGVSHATLYRWTHEDAEFIRAWEEARIVHHAERMELLRDAGLALGPATVPELSHEVFPKRHWGTMAESETFAHLEHMVNVGWAERWEEDGVLHYRVAEAS